MQFYAMIEEKVNLDNLNIFRDNKKIFKANIHPQF